ncbi:HNH endonuclease [Brachybacterium aquaticum]|uniref:HNH endonuclease n=1 Tax=Brachybacterium aquaticum TaxID=1432564 RepID=A0A841ABD4_9MICO|nr:HNH endonuclease [Brachybacterium aquaticum]MBB5832519.1 hypothetical protein [Brachybacterium aquaticum]
MAVDISDLLERGALTMDDDVSFRTHVEVARLFGFEYKGHQQATIRLDEHTDVWFPKLFANRDWINALSPEGLEITMRPADGSQYGHRMETTRREDVIAFGKEGPSGDYRFLGVFRFNPLRSNDEEWVFDRIAASITLGGEERFGYQDGALRAGQDDLTAEAAPVNPDLVREFDQRIPEGQFAVEDREVLTRTRGSARRSFAEEVKSNYQWTCALTGIGTRAFLVASHIVPWSEDTSIRLDPSNGICLSTFVDRAFDAGYLEITPDGVSRVRWERVGDDAPLREELSRFDGVALARPQAGAPDPEKLRRRVELGY